MVAIEGSDPVKTDVVVVSVGRRPATADLGLDGTQVAIDERGFVEVDELCRTGEEGVLGGRRLSSPRPRWRTWASPRPWSRSDGILGEDAMPIDYGKVPWGIYCRPEVAFAGHSEESAREAGLDVVALQAPLRRATAGPRSSATRRAW